MKNETVTLDRGILMMMLAKLDRSAWGAGGESVFAESLDSIDLSEDELRVAIAEAQYGKGAVAECCKPGESIDFAVMLAHVNWLFKSAKSDESKLRSAMFYLSRLVESGDIKRMDTRRSLAVRVVCEARKLKNRIESARFQRLMIQTLCEFGMRQEAQSCAREARSILTALPASDESFSELGELNHAEEGLWNGEK